MKRMLVVVSIATVALTAAGIAVANGIEGAKSVKEVAGTFTATTASSVQSRTCTTSDGKTIVITDGTYTGTAAGDPDLAGPAKIKARSIVNSTDGIGVVSGKIQIDVASGQNTEARFDAVLKGTQLAGFATGRAHDPSAKLLANVSSDFNATTGFANGKIGGTTGGTAAELGPGTCAHSDNDRETSHATGTVTAVSSTSITVAGLTCSVPVSLQSIVSPLTVGSRAEISCSLTAGVNTLVKAKHR